MGRTDEEQIFPVVPVNQTLMGNNIVLRVHVVVKMCFRIIYKLLRVMILLVTQCTIVLIRKNIESIKFISGEASPDMNFIDPM